MAIIASPQKSATAKPMLKRGKDISRYIWSIRIVLDLRARLHIEGASVGHVIDGGQGPRQTDAKEHVDCIAARYVADAVVRGFILLGCNNAGKCI